MKSRLTKPSRRLILLAILPLILAILALVSAGISVAQEGTGSGQPPDQTNTTDLPSTPPDLVVTDPGVDLTALIAEELNITTTVESLLVPAASFVAQSGDDGADGAADSSAINESQNAEGSEDSSEPTLVAAAGLFEYNNRTIFNNDWPGLPVEDFEESNGPAGSGVSCPAPMDETTNNACISPGKIWPGLRFDVSPGVEVADFFNVGSGYPGKGNTSKFLLTNYSLNQLEIHFTVDNVNAVGMNLFRWIGDGNVNINVYGIGNVLLGSTTTSATLSGSAFWGVATADVIKKITIQSAGGDDFEGVDNVAFGGNAVEAYSSRANFESDWPSLPVEDFEESNISDGGIDCPTTGPLDENTNDSMFSPGDILPGIAFLPQPSGAGFPNVLCAIGKNFGTNGNPSKFLLTNWSGDQMEILFPNADVIVVGMDLFQWGIDDFVNIRVYGLNDVLLAATNSAASRSGSNFWGIRAPAPITRITIQSQTNDWEGIDNVAFGRYGVYLPLVGHNICGGFPGSSEIEPNNSAGQANGLLCPGINYQGNPNNNANGASAKDDDWFKIFWDGSGTLTVDVTHYLADAQVLLYHESNTSTELTRDFQKPNGHYTVNYSGNKGAGIYYVRLFAPIGHPTNTGNYNLTVTDN